MRALGNFMKMSDKVRFFLITYIVGAILGFFIVDYLYQGFGALFMVLWFAIFGISQWYILKCPNCGEFSCKDNFLGITFYVPYAKDSCAKCGKDY